VVEVQVLEPEYGYGHEQGSRESPRGERAVDKLVDLVEVSSRGTPGLKRFFQARAISAGDIFAAAASPDQRSGARSVAGALELDASSLGPDATTAGAVASPTIVRIAVYDSMTAPPRVEEVYGDSSVELIDRLSARVYQIARDAGGPIPYIVVRELSENLIHADFHGVVVSVLDDGHSVRIADSGPGIRDVDRALMPGFSTADASMRGIIRGVGSGLPIAAECMRFAGGGLVIEENLGGGAVVTAFADGERARSTDESPLPCPQPAEPIARAQEHGGPRRPAPEHGSDAVAAGPRAREGLPDDGASGAPDRVVPMPRPAPAARQLSVRQKQTLLLVMEIGSVGPTTVSRELTVALSTAHRDLAFLEAEGFIASDSTGKRRLTPLGVSYVESIF
jgi:hypothetical protein